MEERSRRSSESTSISQCWTPVDSITSSETTADGEWDGGSVLEFGDARLALDNSNPQVSSEQLLEHGQTLGTAVWQVRREKVLLVAIEILAWERDGSSVTEIGLAWSFGTRVFSRHLVVREHLNKRNIISRPDQRCQYAYGRSEIVWESKALCLLKLHFAEWRQWRREGREVLMVGSGLTASDTWLKQAARGELGLWIDQVCDISVALQWSERALLPASFLTLLLHYKLPSQLRHNAANAAVLSIQLVLRIASRYTPLVT